MIATGFDRLAPAYRALEVAAFGRDLERARFCLLDRLSFCTRILVLGEGDGRALARLAALARHAEIHCVDVSSAMIVRASRRLTAGDRERVVFHQVDALTRPIPDGPFDAVITMFFFDCFTETQVCSLVAAIAAQLTPAAMWLWADFCVPERGWQRLRARVAIAGLYAFFRWQTGIPARELPPAERLIVDAGFTSREQIDHHGGMVRTRLFARTPGQRLGGAAPGSPSPTAVRTTSAQRPSSR